MNKSKKKKKFKKKMIILISLILVVAFALVMLLIGIKNKKQKDEPTIVGSWTTDGVTIYEFNEDNSGKLIVSLGEYEFTYTFTENKLTIDFKSEKITDSIYKYTLTKDELNLEGDNGNFTFIRRDETKSK